MGRGMDRSFNLTRQRLAISRLRCNSIVEFSTLAQVAMEFVERYLCGGKRPRIFDRRLARGRVNERWTAMPVPVNRSVREDSFQHPVLAIG
jgi:hypothetical protein